MRTYVKNTSTVTLEPRPGHVLVTLCEGDRDPHVSRQYGNPQKLIRSIGADLRAKGYAAS